MTPLRFEQTYDEEWTELERILDEMSGRKRRTGVAPSTELRAGPSTELRAGPQSISGARVATLYRRACDHLALARARAYPAYMIDRLERLTSRAHQAIYYRREYGIARLVRFFAYDFPVAVRRHSAYVAVATATFLIPAIVIALLVYWRSDLILSVVSADTAASFEEMYSPTAESIGRTREASTDWMMFGYYIRNNVGVSFQCFAAGLFAGIGTLFFLGYNGAFAGALAGYLTGKGLSPTFYSFIATHSAFELTAIVLSGAAGLRIGHALLAPGRLSRIQSLVNASQDSVILLYGVTAMLLVAAAVEAFWSSARWLPMSLKFGVAAICWIAVLGYLSFQGRRAD